MQRKNDLIPVRLERDPTHCSTTAYSGILPYFDLWNVLGMPRFIDQTVHICGIQGWLDRQMVQSVVLINLTGGDCVTDIDKLEKDAGLCQMARSGEYSGLSPARRDLAKKRFRTRRTRTLPAATQISSFLEACHNEDEEAKRIPGKAFIPVANEHLKSLCALNTTLVAELQKRSPQKTATLDCDATLVETDTKSALFCYKKYRAYQPYNVWWSEQQVVLHSQFRDGNVPAGWNILDVIKEAVSILPAGVEKIYMRQDTAAYLTDVLAWCEREREHPEFGRVLFTISADISRELREEILRPNEWKPEYRMKKGMRVATGREYAEVMYVPHAHAMMTDIFLPFRYIAIREKLGNQLSLIDVETSEQPSDKLDALPFPTAVMNNVAYKIAAIVTNRRAEDASELIKWHYERCGKSEEAHAIMKGDFAGGQLPSAKFGANAAWWALMILSMNFHTIMKRLVLGSGYVEKRMKALRFSLIHTAGRIVEHSRQVCLRVSDKGYDWLAALREAMRGLRLIEA